jgi:hypothetical protein
MLLKVTVVDTELDLLALSCDAACLIPFGQAIVAKASVASRAGRIEKHMIGAIVELHGGSGQENQNVDRTSFGNMQFC